MLAMMGGVSPSVGAEEKAATPEASPPPPKKAETPPPAEGEGGGDKKKGDGVVTGGRFAGDLIYVHLEPIVLPLINESGAEQIFTVIIDLQVKDFDAADTLHSNMPRVRDTMMRVLYGGLSDGSLRIGRHMIDVIKVKARIGAALEKTMGAKLVDDVLIQDIAQRKL